MTNGSMNASAILRPMSPTIPSSMSPSLQTEILPTAFNTSDWVQFGHAVSSNAT